ncbi:MAG TPA: DUF3108 domain-containing protein [Dokdonella sp.]|uniref:DUF3108 domain-containing protein n=1 Tax=Dokdonella sp. TaxID=2291710 RepID=UPI002CD4647E|nr:DUF3108 domain-containing protein [Dokdonella sp.]HUD40441.1 DUF3108 domain-containing protein [Dokdonella sp.]
MNPYFLIACLAAGSALAAPPAPPLQPFHAEYSVSRNGSELGSATLELDAEGDGVWAFRSRTQGTQGLAKVAGLDVTEQSRLRWRNERLESTAYEYRQDALLKKRTRRGAFDWDRGEVQMSDQDHTRRYRLPAGTLDRHAVTLAIAADLARGASALDYPVAGMDGIETLHYARQGEEAVHVPAGEFRAVRVSREHGPRVSTSWFAASIGWLPVQIEQVDGKKNETITLRLKSLDRH